ncbi:hypothetical protein [Paenirhodobacter populi]|uniref:Uncharacterized protein n=1 Tax=Paenirhodobacter populi TaxID=2306993 RepID=A0A443JU93_9RHOB|nr:hypothetical protein [Sinirhodobacter populi]RWR10689.1 hypothetical protein D2T32_02125 [Sinirhodobacter populi]RWR24090.1 hypothetical protein D2T30_03005 [Sinirhodobacter populi]RWR35294.1 hypothetical protein D2T29_02185 [Sinirhodobacter populi]
MGRGPRPVFLARRSYRRRRAMDAVRLLPVPGTLAVLLPALWQPAPRPALAVVWLFGTWAVLIVLTAVLSRHLAPAIEAEEEALTPADDDPAGGR